MKIRLSQLRRIIQEEVSRVVQEAPFADVLPTAAGPIDDYADDEEDSDKGREKVSRFFSTQAWRNKAKKAFRLWDIPVYVLPVHTSARYKLDLDFVERRMKILDPSEGFDIVEEGKFAPPEVTQSLRAAVEGGGLLILAVTQSLKKGFLPTPWMLVHGFFDSQVGLEGVDPKISELQEELSNVFEDFDASGELPDVADLMTMKSARTGYLKDMPPTDFVGELLTQAALTTSGVTFKPSGDPDLDDRLAGIADRINSADVRRLIQNNLKGRVLVLATEFSEETD